MLEKTKIMEVDRLLREGLSCRNVAKITGASRSTVRDVASGKRGLFGKQHQKNKYLQTGEIERCNECGVCVTMPCVKCRADKAKAQTRENSETRETVKAGYAR